MCASKHRLSNLVTMVDYNKLQSYDRTSVVQELEPLADKWRAFGFAVYEVDGHDLDQLRRVFERIPFETDKPSTIICHTVKGRGIADAEGNVAWHHKSKVSDDEIAAMYAELD